MAAVNRYLGAPEHRSTRSSDSFAVLPVASQGLGGLAPLSTVLAIMLYGDGGNNEVFRFSGGQAATGVCWVPVLMLAARERVLSAVFLRAGLGQQHQLSEFRQELRVAE